MLVRTCTQASRLALFALLVLSGLFVVQSAVGIPLETLDDFLFRWMSPLAPTLATLVIVTRTLTSDRPSAGWLLIAAGQALWAFGAFYYAIALWTADPMPFPSAADAGWLLFYPPTVAGIVLLVRARIAGSGQSVSMLDSAIGALAIGAAGAALAFGAIVDATGGSQLAIATNLAYPLGDLALVAVMVGGLATTGWRLGRGWTLLLVGFLLFGIADTSYVFQVATDNYDDGIINAGWVLSSAVVALAIWQPWENVRVRTQDWSAFIFPATFGAVGLGVLVYDHFWPVHLLALVLATACVAAVIGRMSLIFQENLRVLSSSRIEATTDALRGLGNRRKLLNDLAAVEQGQATLVLLDLDGFKIYNDTYGHPAGDALLARLGDRLAGAAAAGDGVDAYRLGGDEFCLLSHDADRAQEHARTASEALCEHGDGFDITSSYGTATMPADANDPVEALRVADQRMYTQKHSRESSAGRQSKNVLLSALVERNPTLVHHLTDVAELAVDVARLLALPEHEIEQVRHAAELHDVGKVAIPDAILQKAGPLTDEEWGFVHEHTLIGARIISAAPALAHVARLVRSSHERWDGAGYPDRLVGDEIPIGSRIVSACDALAAMVTNRPYREAVDLPAALEELARCAGSQFDPAVVGALTVALTTAPAEHIAA
jgi:two-component system, cell cycle response regulator